MCALIFVLRCNVKYIYFCESQIKVSKPTALAIVLLNYTSSASRLKDNAKLLSKTILPNQIPTSSVRETCVLYPHLNLIVSGF